MTIPIGFGGGDRRIPRAGARHAGRDYRIWLADHPTPETQDLTTRTPTELDARRQELLAHLAGAPDDHRQLIDRITTSHLDAAELHATLTAAMSAQNERRDWILANWPYLVELEQITKLINAREPVAHWPTSQPPEVARVLEQLRALAPRIKEREDRTLADIARQEVDADPVQRLEARREHLAQLAGRAIRSDEHSALEAELEQVQGEIRAARRDRRAQQAFDRYRNSKWETARTRRMRTVEHDLLTMQPDWPIADVRELHEAGQLEACDVDDLARRYVARAVAIDAGPIGSRPDVLARSTNAIEGATADSVTRARVPERRLGW